MTTTAQRRIIPSAWRNPINRVLNLALYLLGCFMLGTGWVMWQRLPRGSGYRNRAGPADHADNAILGLTRHEWGDWHLYAGLALVALSILHLLMNWTWMVKIAASSKAWPLIVGLAAGLVVIAFFVLIPKG